MDILEYIKRVNANFDKQPEPRYNTKKYFTDNVDDIGPGPNNRNKIPRLNVMPEMYNSEEQGSGVMIDPRGLQDGKIPLPTQGLNKGGIATPKRGLVDEPGSYAGKTDSLGRTYDYSNFGRKPSLKGKTGQIVMTLQDLKKGSAVNLEQLSKDLDLGKDGSSLIKKVIKNREELKNKNFRSVTKEEKTITKINDFIENYITTNSGKIPTQGEIQKGAKVDPTYLRKYIDEGKVNNVAQTFFDQNKKAANYILNTKNPTIKGIEKIIGDTAVGISTKGDRNKIRSAESLLSRVYINSLNSLTNKLTKTDEGRSIYKDFDSKQIETIKNKVRQIPGFNSYYEREITDLVADAYKNDEKKENKSIKKNNRI